MYICIYYNSSCFSSGYIYIYYYIWWARKSGHCCFWLQFWRYNVFFFPFLCLEAMKAAGWCPGQVQITAGTKKVSRPGGMICCNLPDIFFCFWSRKMGWGFQHFVRFHASFLLEFEIGSQTVCPLKIVDFLFTFAGGKETRKTAA